jgi:hypothetical protein
MWMIENLLNANAAVEVLLDRRPFFVDYGTIWLGGGPQINYVRK